MRNLLRSLLAAAALAALAALSAAPTIAQVVVPPGFADQRLVGGLDLPTSFAFLPDGRTLITEKQTGMIKLITSDFAVPPKTVYAVTDVRSEYTERGLLSITVDPGWPTRPYVYVHYTSTSGFIRLVRLTAKGQLGASYATNLALGLPYVVLDSIPDQWGPHNGGALRFGPDGKLYLSLGEDFGWCPAQDPTTLNGKVLRLDVSRLPAGMGGPPPTQLLVPADNPWASSPMVLQRLIYASGFRNPFRFQIDPATGLLYVGDVGDARWEELDEVRAGDDCGWPYREGPVSYSAPPSCGPGGTGYLEPIMSYDHDQGSVILAAGVIRQLPGSFWPTAWQGNVLYADFEGQYVRMIHKGATGWKTVTISGVPDPEYLFDGLLEPVDFQWSRDGDLWWLSHQDYSGKGTLHRIRAISNPTGVGALPVATRLTLTATPNPSRGGMRFSFTVPAAGHARLGLYDVSGRSIATLFDGEVTAGTHEQMWGGSDHLGGALRAGLYLAKLETSRGIATTRVLRLE